MILWDYFDPDTTEREAGWEEQLWEPHSHAHRSSPCVPSPGGMIGVQSWQEPREQNSQEQL